MVAQSMIWYDRGPRVQNPINFFHFFSCAILFQTKSCNSLMKRFPIIIIVIPSEKEKQGPSSRIPLPINERKREESKRILLPFSFGNLALYEPYVMTCIREQICLGRILDSRFQEQKKNNINQRLQWLFLDSGGGWVFGFQSIWFINDSFLLPPRCLLWSIENPDEWMDGFGRASDFWVGRDGWSIWCIHSFIHCFIGFASLWISITEMITQMVKKKKKRGRRELEEKRTDR